MYVHMGISDILYIVKDGKLYINLDFNPGLLKPQLSLEHVLNLRR
jgi:hypothetical protein